ncbi:MAG: lipocalin/fatty-acid binding family protein [Snowella sp.]|nr:lipocalin/fatty-acid binding family protein [Snowella sp.]
MQDSRTMMDFNFNGKYTRVSAENLDEYLKCLEIGFILRKSYTAATPIVEITETAPGKWKMVTTTSTQTSAVEFEEGVQCDEITFDGRDCKTTFVFETETRLIQEQKSIKAGGKDTKLIWDCYSDKLVLQMICEDVTSISVFKRN